MTEPLRSTTWSCLFALLAACSSDPADPGASSGGSAGSPSSSGGITAAGGSSAQGGTGGAAVVTGGASGATNTSGGITSGGNPSSSGGASGGSAQMGGTGVGGNAGTAGAVGGNVASGGALTTSGGAAGAPSGGAGMKGSGGASGSAGKSSGGGGGAGGASGSGGKSSGGAGGGASGSGGKASGGTGGGGGSGGAACPYTGHVSYNLAKAANPSAAQTTAYGLITTAMDKALAYYNCYTNITKSLNVVYEPSVQTADGNINGSLRFGSNTTYMDYRTAMHEIGHTVGVGQASNWSSFLANGLFTGTNALAQLRAINATLQTPLYTDVHADAQHFWPYGINQQSEVKSEADLIAHCQMVVAIRKDLGLQ